MQSTTLPGLPARRAADYMLDEFDPPRYARVIYTLQESGINFRQIESQAFEVNASGSFQSAPNGSPSRTPSTMHRIMLSGVGDTHTLQAGWVRVVGTFDEQSLPEGTAITDVLPDTGTEGQLLWCNDKLHKWSIGMVEEILRAKAGELAGILRNSAAMEEIDL